MEEVKELTKEIHGKIDDIVAAKKTDKNTKSVEFFRLAGKANLMLRRLLLRSAQLDKEMLAMKEISQDIKARRDEYAEALDADPEMTENKRIKKESELRLSSVVEKIKNLITDMDNQGDADSSEADELSNMAPSSDDFKVRVSKIKGEDGKALWAEDKDEMSESTTTEGAEMEIEEKLKRASKKMERLVKNQLENAGINPGGMRNTAIIMIFNSMNLIN